MGKFILINCYFGNKLKLMHLTYICEAEISKSGQINIRGKTLWKYEHKRRDFPLKHFDFGETCVFFGKPCTMALWHY